jgi:hypothetical protein
MRVRLAGIMANDARARIPVLACDLHRRRRRRNPKMARREPQDGAAPTPSGRGVEPKRTWRQTQIHANFFQ